MSRPSRQWKVTSWPSRARFELPGQEVSGLPQEENRHDTANFRTKSSGREKMCAYGRPLTPSMRIVSALSEIGNGVAPVSRREREDIGALAARQREVVNEPEADWTHTQAVPMISATGHPTGQDPATSEAACKPDGARFGKADKPCLWKQSLRWLSVNHSYESP